MWSFDVYVIMVHIEIDLDKLSIYLYIYLSIYLSIYIYIYMCVCKDQIWIPGPRDGWTQAQKAQNNEFVESGLEN